MKSFFIYSTVIFFSFYSCSSQNNELKSERERDKTKTKLRQTNNSEQKKTFKIFSQEKGKYKTVSSVPVPAGYKRIKIDSESFGFWLRNIEIKTENNNLYLYDGSLKPNQNFHFAVLKFDVGKRDLQQCADAVMRLRAEYLYSQKKYDKIHFNFVSDGKPRYYTTYAGNDHSYKKFRNYLNYVFSYANTASLKKELVQVDNPNKNIKSGDVFIQSGKPYGHAVIVIDVAENEKGERIFMLAQSYMPAQEIHIVKNLNNKNISPWYNFTDTEKLIIPEWKFNYSDLRRF